jgi:hypothetical protein
MWHSAVRRAGDKKTHERELKIKADQPHTQDLRHKLGSPFAATLVWPLPAYALPGLCSPASAASERAEEDVRRWSSRSSQAVVKMIFGQEQRPRVVFIS